MTTRQKKREELDERAKQGETVVPGGTGGKNLEAQEHLAEEAEKAKLGRSSWDQKDIIRCVQKEDRLGRNRDCGLPRNGT
ncbi:hypothetical protein Ahy_B04g071032 [Arachis hypogaea]|uniref:Uncharacterized protein n=1 Tax=Arachis hypogaea TaxID=3818 RepID=A0A444ZJT7_ARAHY|nr:hypothetical protein Ahy_B04g071032 [Arachis hypogaea]